MIELRIQAGSACNLGVRDVDIAVPIQGFRASPTPKFLYLAIPGLIT